MSDRPEQPRAESGVLGEPTVGFALAAVALFLLSWLSGPGDDRVVRIDPDELAWRVEQAEMARGAPLSEELRREVEDAYVDERILAREARAMGLDDDPRIDDMLAQKMLHVLSGEVIQPTEAELEAHYRDNLDAYTPSPTVDVDEIVVPLTAPDPSALPASVLDGTPLEALVGSELRTHRVMASLDAADLTDLFDARTAEAALSADEGDWVGPHESPGGYHWLRVTSVSTPGPLPLDRVREQVRLDWIAEREEAMLDRRLEALREEYRVVRGVEGDG